MAQSHSAATDHLEKLVNSSPQFAEMYQKMLEDYGRKLWHQLYLKVESFVNANEVRQTVDLVQFYKSFISDFASKLNQTKHVLLAINISRQIQSLDDRIAFIKHIAELKYVSDDKEGWTLARASLAELQVSKSNADEAGKLLEDCEKTIKELDFVDSLVHAAYYRSLTLLHKLKNEPQEFYRSGLSYLAYAKVDQVDKTERAGLSFDLGVAGLIGEDIYNFGELVENQIFDSLRGTANEWLAHVVMAFNNGEIEKWLEMEKQYSAQLNSQPGLVENKRIMDQKIAILALMQLVFSRGSLDRTLSFGEVSQVTKVPHDQVELLLMRALSLELIKGRIDQVAQTISITWVQPRVLSREQVATMRDKLSEWSVKVDGALRLMEHHMTPELKA